MNKFHEMFFCQMKQNPNKTAISYKDETITFQELDQRSNALVKLMRDNNIKEGDIVPIISERCIEMVIAIIAVIKLGACYLPIDSLFPWQRISYMIDNSQAKCILISSNCLNEFKHQYISTVCIPKLDEIPLICSMEEYGPVPVDAPIYLIYTSGTTDQPKGVLIPHDAVINLITSISSILNLNERLNMVSLTTISFDIFAFESLLPLALGMSVIIADPMNFFDDLTQKEIDIIQTTPTTMRLILQDVRNAPIIKNLKYIFLGGEPFPQILLHELKKITSAKIFNMYGPTETTVWSTIKELTDTDKITLGVPIDNTELYVLSDEGEILTSKDQEGELCIAGKGLALGYWKDKDKTNDKFQHIPINELSVRIYRTGDLVRYDEHGELLFLGRNDLQKKIRGFRIEIEEIEYIIEQHDDIQFACVAVLNQNDEDMLVCYYVSDCFINMKEMVSYLSIRLPNYMIPQKFIRIRKFPLLPNGKLDRKEISNLSSVEIMSLNTNENDELSMDEVFSVVYNACKSILSSGVINLHDSFLEMGLTSVGLASILQKLSPMYPLLTISDFFSFPTIEKLSAYIQQHKK